MAWYFVTVWGSGYIATKIGIQYAAPFTFLSLRYALGMLCLLPVLLLLRPEWPRAPRELAHVVAAGLLMHGIQLSGSHYAQYLGLSAGVVALILSVQPLITAMVAKRWMHERLAPRQWTGIALGLAGVLLVVWHKIDVRVMTLGALVAITVSLAGVTAGTLYQRVFCPTVNLYSAAWIQFAASLLLLTPLAFAFEGARVQWTWALFGAIAFLVVFASIFAVNALHTLMRHGQATKVTSILYLTPIFAVVLEYLLFGVVPSGLTFVGIAVTCLGVALVTASGQRPAAA
ncbi:MAG: DMT family transporter [Betaproteobacteria bacterium]|nr:DMT family transporter [Betaproteobacteria bacterium]